MYTHIHTQTQTHAHTQTHMDMHARFLLPMPDLGTTFLCHNNSTRPLSSLSLGLHHSSLSLGLHHSSLSFLTVIRVASFLFSFLLSGPRSGLPACRCKPDLWRSLRIRVRPTEWLLSQSRGEVGMNKQRERDGDCNSRYPQKSEMAKEKRSIWGEGVMQTPPLVFLMPSL